MATDWSMVTLDHVTEACALYDAGDVRPSRPAQNTFLLIGERRYPAKFIRGLAHKLATGSLPDVYHGGAETVRFFRQLGLATEYHGKLDIPDRSSALPSTNEHSVSACAANSLPRCEQKRAILSLLNERFGAVETEASFPWLAVPRVEQMSGLIREIHQTLEAMRGFSGFATAGRRLHCDFHVPDRGIVIEYDERQHFTLARAAALRLYPDGLNLHFDCQEWVTVCEKVRGHDPTPPYRDEQRAFYDTLRDIRATENDRVLIRLRDGTFD